MIEEFYDNAAVRRQDRLLDTVRAEELLEKAEYGVLSMVGDNGEPYGVPLNFVWDKAATANGCGITLYAHCAPEGRKLRAIAMNASVSFCVVGNVRPLPEKLTTLYESLVMTGKARIGLGAEERRRALRLLVGKLAPEMAEKCELPIERSFHRTEIIRLDVERLSGKAKRLTI